MECKGMPMSRHDVHFVQEIISFPTKATKKKLRNANPLIFYKINSFGTHRAEIFVQSNSFLMMYTAITYSNFFPNFKHGKMAVTINKVKNLFSTHW